MHREILNLGRALFLITIGNGLALDFRECFVQLVYLLWLGYPVVGDHVHKAEQRRGSLNIVRHIKCAWMNSVVAYDPDYIQRPLYLHRQAILD